ncbi:MAG: serine hydroxymethyltransferase [Desulfobulbus sp.]|nr:MAG: serine hydroxymethyltransferase [Desulfobulbus sp.]RUM38651.1 MAG: serine hydroxymethyltransferase [Desulfobulbus sp.]
MQNLIHDDPQLAELALAEEQRLQNTINLIAAENHSPQSILDITGSAFNTKTIEGYPGKRFHAGCVNVDSVETLAIKRAKHLFGAEYVNVQPHSGSSANLAVYFSVLEIGDTVLAMSLPHGGHLSHGHKASITSKCFNFSHYEVNPQTGLIDYEQVRKTAHSLRPKMIVAGASSYPRLIDYKLMAEIAKEVSAYFMVDMAHIAGLVAAGVIPSPVAHSDFTTFTCYKTMMGGRGGVILARKEFASRINSAVFPGCQGTTAANLLAAKALIFKLAMDDLFVAVQKKTLANARNMSRAFLTRGYTVISGGTDNHQVIIDLTNKKIPGKTAEQALEAVGIIINRNVVPADAGKPGQVSGIRLGSGAISARGMGSDEVDKLVEWMDCIMARPHDTALADRVGRDVLALCHDFPVNA